MSEWHSLCDDFVCLLKNTVFTDSEARILSADDAFARLTAMGRELRENGRFCYCAGNGASAAMASHFAADVGKNARIRTQVFTDPALLTAVGNDIAYAEVYAEPLRRHCAAGDMLLAVSSSGNSPNIVAAVRAVREKGGVVVTFSAMRPDNAIRALGDINVYVSASTYGAAESAHAFLLHRWTDMLTKGMNDE